MKDFYEEINRSLTPIEQGRYSARTLDWCVNRVDWCWKWRKITKEQMEELANRICACYDTQLAIMASNRRK